MRCLSLILGVALLQAPRPAIDPAFLLQPGRAGAFDIGMTVDRVYKIADREKTQLVDLFLEGHFEPALVIRLDGSSVERPLVARIRQVPCNEYRVWGITVNDPRFRTAAGIGVGSSLAEVRRHYAVEPTWGEGERVAVAKTISMTFLLSDATDAATVRSVWLFPGPDAVANCAQREAPADYKVRLDTSKGPIVIAVHRHWAPHGADRFHELVASGYYDDARFFRIRKGTWAQFVIAADPKVEQAWRTKTIPDDTYICISTMRGTVAFAFKDPNGRTTQVFINLKDNSETHDKEPFVVFGEIERGMEAADALYADYGEAAGGGIRAGKQDPVFEGGNGYLKANFPLLDYISTARVLK